MNGATSGSSFQQTVRLAIDCHTGELMAAPELLALQESEFTALRREAMQARVNRRRGGTSERFRCAICDCPLYLSRRITGNQNRWFVHDGRADDCPWFEGSRLAPEQIKALVYRGQQEGQRHREMKDYIAHWLRHDPLVQDVCLEKTTFSEVVKGEWRRPDVKCTYRGMRLVFEIQLSYTFLSDVIERDAFYRREKTFVIWVFARFDSTRAAVTDEAFFNRRNLFVLDAQARQYTTERTALTFNGLRQIPSLSEDHSWSDTWTPLPVGLHEVNFPPSTYRPFFFDYEATREGIEIARIKANQAKEARLWTAGINAYRNAAIRFFANDHGDDEQAILLAVVDELEENVAWHRGFEALRDSRFFGYHGVLAVLMSIQSDAPFSYNSKLSVFQVIEAGLRTSSHVSKHAYAVLHLWAYKTYRPRVSNKHRHWLIKYAGEVKRSLERGETEYRRDTTFDEAIRLLFPALQEQLSMPFGTVPANEWDDDTDNY
jgi:hypothetical protein